MWQFWRETRKPEAEWKRWALAIALGIFLQWPLMMAIQLIIEYSVSDVQFKPVGVKTVTTLLPEERTGSPEEASKPPIAEPQQDPNEPETLPDIVPDGTEKPVGQVVTIAPPETEDMPDEARFASRFASKVAEEMKARTPTKEQTPPDRQAKERQKRRIPRSRKGSPTANENAADEEGTREAKDGAGDEVGKTGEQQSGLEKGASLDGQALYSPSVQGMDPVAKYAPSKSPFASDDYLPGVKEGDTNALNSVPYRYAGFFERVKQRVRQQWNPNRPYRLRDPSGEIYGHKDRLTVLSVVLDSRGYVLDTSITAPSGLKFLDDEAVRAMAAASPFLNPPEGLVGEDGKIRFDFGFAFLVASSRHQFFWRLQ